MSQALFAPQLERQLRCRAGSVTQVLATETGHFPPHEEKSVQHVPIVEPCAITPLGAAPPVMQKCDLPPQEQDSKVPDPSSKAGPLEQACPSIP